MGRAKESKKDRDARVREILRRLDDVYGTDLICYLEHQDPWQLLVATILSAQCTDARVNQVTGPLFAKYDTIEKFAEASQEELEEDIRSTGFFRMKAEHIRACARDILVRFGGEVPSSIEDLTSLPGVGRKTANVIRGNIYHEPSIVVDTHVRRISQKLGLTQSNDPAVIEQDLMKILPEDHWILWNIHIITLGRTVCPARSPHCGECFLSDCCPAGTAG